MCSGRLTIATVLRPMTTVLAHIIIKDTAAVIEDKPGTFRASVIQLIIDCAFYYWSESSYEPFMCIYVYEITFMVRFVNIHKTK